MTDDVRIQVNAMVDGAVTNLNKVNTALGKTGTAAEKSGGGFKSMAGKVDGVVRSITGVSLSTLGWVGAALKVVDVVKKSVDGFIQYSNQIQDISRLTGASAEEMSRLVQVGDDVRLTYEQMKTSMQIASRQGIDVSIDGIKRLSEQYAQLEPGLERSQFLLTTFGRSGADMGRLLEMRADGIDKATAAVSAGLVMDEKAIAKAEALRLAKDNLGDSITALENQLAGALVPALAAVVEGLVGVIGAGDRFIQWISNQVNKTEIANRSALKLSGTYEEYRGELDKSAQASGYLIDESGNLVQVITYQNQVTHKLIEANYAYTEQGWKMVKAQEGMNDMAAEGIVYFGDLRSTLGRLAEQEAESAIQAAADLSDTLTGQMELTLKLTDLTGNYTDKMEELKDKHGELEEKLAGLKLKFPWDKAGIAEAEQALIDNQAEIDKTADAYDLATKRIVWDMMVAKLAIDGYTQAEFNWAMQAGVDMGIITQESADLAVALMADSDKQIKAFEDAQAAAEAYQQMISGMTGTEISIVTHYVYDYTGAGEAGQIGDPGGGTLVPRGGGGAMRPGQYFDVNEMDGAPPERVRSGYGGYVSTTTNYNMTINAGNVSTNDVIFGFRTLESLGD